MEFAVVHVICASLVFLTGPVEANSQSSIGLTIPNLVSTIVNDPATLPATFRTGHRLLSIVWYKLDSTDKSKRTLVYSYYPAAGTREAHGDFNGRASLAGKASLRIDRTTEKDDGTYVLAIMVEGVGNEEGFVKLSILVPPRVNVGPSNPYVTAWGRSATLTCGVRGAKPNITSLHWKKDGERIVSRPLDAKYTGGNMQKPNLQIRHMTRADAGMYTCVADHIVRSTSASLVVDVLYPASIISISDSVTATVSDSVTLQCVADGNPPPNITWTKDGSRLRSVNSALTGDVRMGSYLIKSVQANDTGTFLCTAENDIGESSTKSLSLTIKQLRRKVATSTIAVVVGATAGGLWLVVCVGLAVYVARRRKRKEEKKKFAFYYNMGRRDPGNGDERLEEDKEPPPYSSVPAKPTSKTPSYGGINTMRKSLGKKERRYARAMYAYRPREDNELRLETDDIIEVLEGEDGGWCLGYLRGRIGLFPSNYVKFISSSEVLAMKAGGPCQTLALQESVGSKRSI